MESTSGWTWDPNRQMYYAISAAEGCYVYTDGTRVPIQSSQSSRSSGGYYASSSTAAPSAVSSVASRQASQASAAYTYGSSSTAAPSAVSTAALARQLGGLQLASADNDDDDDDSDSDDEDTSDKHPPLHNITRDETGLSTTDPKLLGAGIKATVKVGSTPGKKEKLDPKFRVRKPANRFFKRGKVFRILWPEPMGAADQGSNYSQGAFNEPVYMKVRWFVVIREGHDFCSCLPINTYNGRGVAKKSVIKSEHAIVYTGSKVPRPSADEVPRKYGEMDMQPPIQVKAIKKADVMDEMARINFAKVYTVEHNVKVHDFGDVHKSDIKQLIKNFKVVWKMGRELEEEEDLDEAAEDEVSAQAAKLTQLVNQYVAYYSSINRQDLVNWLQNAAPEDQIAHIQQAQQATITHQQQLAINAATLQPTRKGKERR